MKAEIRERDVERYLIKQVKLFAGEVRKVKWIGRAGAPDRVVFLRGVAFVELKRPGKWLEPHQVREHMRIRNASQVPCVTMINSIGGVDKFIYDRMTEVTLPRPITMTDYTG